MVTERIVLEVSPARSRDGEEAERIAEGRKERVAASAASRIAISSSLTISIGISGKEAWWVCGLEIATVADWAGLEDVVVGDSEIDSEGDSAMF